MPRLSTTERMQVIAIFYEIKNHDGRNYYYYYYLNSVRPLWLVRDMEVFGAQTHVLHRKFRFINMCKNIKCRLR